MVCSGVLYGLSDDVSDGVEAVIGDVYASMLVFVDVGIC